MSKRIEEGVGGFCQHYPRVAAMVSVRSRGMDNVMPAAWHIPLSKKPPLFGVSIAPQRFTYEMILEANEFVVNFVPLAKVDLIAATGGTSGRDTDKFAQFAIARERPVKISSPIMADAYAAYECLLHDHVTYGDHEFFVGQIVATHYEEEALLADSGPDVTQVMPAVYLANDRYAGIDPGTVALVPRWKKQR